jgi:hypothetical protein
MKWKNILRGHYHAKPSRAPLNRRRVWGGNVYINDKGETDEKARVQMQPSTGP